MNALMNSLPGGFHCNFQISVLNTFIWVGTKKSMKNMLRHRTPLYDITNLGAGESYCFAIISISMKYLSCFIK
jgi:hypothetical protein